MDRNTRTLVVLLVAVAMAGVASYGVYVAVKSIPGAAGGVAHDARRGGQPLTVGTLVTKDDVKWHPGPRPRCPARSRASTRLRTEALSQSVAENEPLTETKLAKAGAGAGLPPTITEGMRAISVRVNEVVGVAGFVVPGNHVDVLVSITRSSERQASDTITRVVVEQRPGAHRRARATTRRGQEEGKPIPTTVVTLLVTPEDAEKVTLAADEGRIMLTLRNPLDVAPTKTTGARRGLLFAGESPPVVQRPQAGTAARAARGAASAAGAETVHRGDDSCREAGGGDRSLNNVHAVLWPRTAAVVTLLAGRVRERRPLRSLPRLRHPAAPSAAGRTSACPSRPADRSVLTTDFDITRIAITNPAVADAVVVQPREILIDGKAPGTVSLIVWGGGARKQYDFVVDPGVAALQQQFQHCFRAKTSASTSPTRRSILSGQRLQQRRHAARGRDRDGELVEAEGHQPAAAARRQREPAGHAAGALRRGQSARAHGTGRELLRATARAWAGRATTQQFAAPDFDDGRHERLPIS